jgi:hypothetical protein
MRFPGGVSTTDQTKVTCTRCAKKHGFVAAVEVKVEKNPSGICACCFNKQKIAKTDNMWLHGYTRPGHGWLVGNCPGIGFQPYEKSVEGTKYMVTLVEGHLSDLFKRLERVKNAESLEVKLSYWDAESRARKDFFGTVTKAEGSVVLQDPNGNTGRFWFDSVQRGQMNDLQSQIRMAEKDLQFFSQKVAEWKPAA